MAERARTTSGRRVKVAVPTGHIDVALTYAVPAALEARVFSGVRVQVPLSGRKVIGLVLGDDDEPPPKGLKLVHAVLDETAVVSEAQLALCAFISRYYLVAIGEAVRLIMPPDTPRAVTLTYALTDRGRTAQVFDKGAGLKKGDREVLVAFDEGEHKTQAQLARIGAKKNRLDRLVVGGLLSEVARPDAPKARLDRWVWVSDDGEALPKRATALAALDAWLRVESKRTPGPIKVSEARALFPRITGHLRRLVELGRVEVTTSHRPQRHAARLSGHAPHPLSAPQAEATAAICGGLETGDAGGAFLLEGVTGSGKTEVYLESLRRFREAGKGAIFVVPEISLTPQLLGRIEAAVDDEVCVLHSRLGKAERRDAHARLLAGDARVAVGARSALFAPVQDLGLIVVDEEHDGSLKQDSSPRYHGRDVALWRAKREGATCVLGSATPSLESVFNARAGKLTQLLLPTRFGGGGAMPSMEVVDLTDRGRIHQAKELDRAHTDGASKVVLSRPLQLALVETLEAGEQSLLFLNRRGWAAALLCESCGFVVECPHCSVSLTLHRGRNLARCHQCDHEQRPPEICPVCSGPSVIQLGVGTERVEQEVRAVLEEAGHEGARIARLDRDTTSKAGALEEVLQAMQARDIDVLIGTQMVAKGHDFPGIALVGVVLADVALALPDFRASERAFALLTQVAGRAGRGERRGRVMVQTYNPDHPAVQAALTQDKAAFVEAELETRTAGRWPPVWRAALVRVDGEDPTAVDALARRAAERLRSVGRGALARGTWDVLGPAPAPIERVKNRTRHQVFVKAADARARERLLRAVLGDEGLRRDLQRAGCRLHLDVDPHSVL